MTLEEVRDRLHADDEHKWDTLAERHRIRIHGGRLFFAGMSLQNFPRGLELTPWATGQLCQKLNIPTTYFKRCPAHLQDAQVSHWLWKMEEAEKEEQWLLRMKGDRVRGILSPRYTKIGHSEIAEILTSVCNPRLKVEWLAVTDESLHLRLVDPTLSRDVLPGDRVIAGIHIGNSEVGKRAVTVDALVYRLVCLNGLIRLVKGRSLLHQRHIHLSSPLLSQALQSALREALVHSTGFMERMHQATKEPVSKEEEVITALSSSWGLSNATSDNVRQALKTEPFGQRTTLYGLVNAFTQTAQSLEPDERYALEVQAGKLLEQGLPPLAILSRYPPQERQFSFEDLPLAATT